MVAVCPLPYHEVDGTVYMEIPVIDRGERCTEYRYSRRKRMRFFYSRRDEDKLPRIVRLFFAGLTLYSNYIGLSKHSILYSIFSLIFNPTMALMSLFWTNNWGHHTDIPGLLSSSGPHNAR